LDKALLSAIARLAQTAAPNCSGSYDICVDNAVDKSIITGDNTVHKN